MLSFPTTTSVLSQERGSQHLFSEKQSHNIKIQIQTSSTFKVLLSPGLWSGTLQRSTSSEEQISIQFRVHIWIQMRLTLGFKLEIRAGLEFRFSLDIPKISQNIGPKFMVGSFFISQDFHLWALIMTVTGLGSKTENRSFLPPRLCDSAFSICYIALSSFTNFYKH